MHLPWSFLLYIVPWIVTTFAYFLLLKLSAFQISNIVHHHPFFECCNTRTALLSSGTHL
jgi:hypothetical protein